MHLAGTDIFADDYFEALGQRVQCKDTSYTGELKTSSLEVTIIPSHKECESEADPATVTMNGCDFVFVGNGEVDSICPGGKLIEMHVYNNAGHTQTNCTFTILPELALTGVTYENETSTGDIAVGGTIEGINGQAHGPCSFGLTINFSTGIYNVSFTVEGTPNIKIDVG